ncbi:MAG: 4-alpha-glucanotransferase [Burkholderiaceae bacterium]
MDKRSSGVLLHPSSLPGRFGSGDFGPESRHFVDWLAGAGQHFWQVLPFAPPGSGNSPYMSMSTLAGDPMLVSPENLVAQGLLPASHLETWVGSADSAPEKIDFLASGTFRRQALSDAFRRFDSKGADNSADYVEALDKSFASWCADNAWWAPDYALYMSISDAHDGQTWQSWPLELRARQANAISAAQQQYATQIRFWLFVQWQFDRQWQEIRQYAAERNVQIIGDMPIYCALDSVDVWQNPSLFQLDASLMPTLVAGVPPDYFSDTGQLWGNPLYHWPAHRQENFQWWVARMRRAMQHADIVRIDHFRAMAQYWAVPADAATAIDGQWLDGPGKELFDQLANELGGLPIIAEDLGVITPDVTELRDAIGLPGMCVLQFAFGGVAENRYAPHNLASDCVLYTGTHDNNTSQGWYQDLADHERAVVQTYLKSDGHEIHWDLIHAASGSVATTAIYPMQDILGLGSECRTNTPGESAGQWSWRLTWDQVAPWHAERLRAISEIHGRHPPMTVQKTSNKPG